MQLQFLHRLLENVLEDCSSFTSRVILLVDSCTVIALSAMFFLLGEKRVPGHLAFICATLLLCSGVQVEATIHSEQRPESVTAETSTTDSADKLATLLLNLQSFCQADEAAETLKSVISDSSAESQQKELLAVLRKTCRELDVLNQRAQQALESQENATAATEQYFDELTPSYVQALIDTVPGWNISQAEIFPLSGGLSNANFLVNINNGSGVVSSYVLRFLPSAPMEKRCSCGASNSDSLAQEGAESGVAGEVASSASQCGSQPIPSLAVDRKQECQVQVLASRLGVGPGVVHFNQTSHVYVSEFLDGVVLSDVDATQRLDKDRLRRVMFSVRQFHQGAEELKASVRSYDPFSDIKGYYRLARSLNASLPPDVDQALSAMEAIRNATLPYHVLRLCHNDLHPGNFIDNGTHVHIIDYEYAGVGNLFFELANLAVKFQIEGEDALRSLLLDYFGEAANITDVDLAHLQLMKTLKLLDSALWGYWQSRASKLDNGFDYKGYGDRAYQSFMNAIATEEHVNNLDLLKSKQQSNEGSHAQTSRWKTLLDWFFRPSQRVSSSDSSSAKGNDTRDIDKNRDNESSPVKSNTYDIDNYRGTESCGVSSGKGNSDTIPDTKHTNHEGIGTPNRLYLKLDADILDDQCFAGLNVLDRIFNEQDNGETSCELSDRSSTT